MTTSDALQRPDHDPSVIFEHLRGCYGSELLTASVAHFNVFGRLAEQSLSTEELGRTLQLADRPVVVLTTALRAMGLLEARPDGTLAPTPLAKEHLLPGGDFDVSDYVGLLATAPGVLEMVERLRTNRPAGLDGSGEGAAFIYRSGIRSAMEEQELARHFTLALAGRARNVAPALAAQLPLDGATSLLDVGGGTGIYSIAYLQQHPQLRATVLDRPEVLKTAAEFGQQFGVDARLQLLPADMFTADLPPADVVLLSNVLHDWDVDTCRELIGRCASALRTGGRLLVHDVLLNDELDGPLPIALYSAALFTLTEGRAYSRLEYHDWLTAAGLEVAAPIRTLAHCHVIAATKAS